MVWVGLETGSVLWVEFGLTPWFRTRVESHTVKESPHGPHRRHRRRSRTPVAGAGSARGRSRRRRSSSASGEEPPPPEQDPLGGGAAAGARSASGESRHRWICFLICSFSYYPRVFGLNMHNLKDFTVS